jgi:signal transduction histidine kinase
VAVGDPRRATTAPNPRTASAPLLAVLAIAAVAVAVAVALWGLAVVRSDATRGAAEADAERQAGTIAVRLQEVESVVEHLPGRACAGEPPSRVRSGSALGVPQGLTVLCVAVERGKAIVPPGEGGAAPFEVDDAVRVALAQAQGDGVGVLAAPSGDARPAVLVAAIYRRDGGLLREPPEAGLVRPDDVAGYVVGLVDVSDLLDGSGRDVELLDGSTVLGATGEVGDAVRTDFSALDRRWTLRAEIEEPGWRRPFAISVTMLGLLGVLLLGIADRRRREELRVLAEEASRAEDRAGAVRTLAGIVQQSQGLDEILPALAVRLGDELDLAGISLSVSTGVGEEREVFVHGTPPDRSVVPDGRRPPVLTPGTTMAFDLHRADRSIGVLRVVAGAPVDPGGLDLAQLAGEMVTSTIVATRSLEQQQEAVTRLESLDELKTTFLGVASHELRTPATAISGLATLLAERWDALGEGDRRAFADRIATNATALNALVQDLLDFARLERGDLELALGPVDLSQAVDAVLTRLDSVWGSHAVERAIAPGVSVLGDVNALERIVTNLVSNAVKFSPEGAGITVTVEEVDGRARLVVDDAGPGVPPEEREKIFVRFFRGSGDAVVRTRGVGIGLSVVHDFVGQMGGAVRVEESPAGGARFVVDLAAVDRARRGVADVAST